MIYENFADGTAQALGEMTGILEGTRVASRAGWCRIEDVVPGMDILTFDGGFQTVRAVERRPLWDCDGAVPEALWPCEVPAGVLGNRDPLHLMPRQSVLVEIDKAEEIYGDPFALLPVSALEGSHGIVRVHCKGDMGVTTLRFDTEQVVFANSGVMFLCPPTGDLLDLAAEEDDVSIYNILSEEDARDLAMHLTAGVPADATPLEVACPV